MNPTIVFNFTVDKENKKINVERSFNAPLELVWKAWTTAELLDQWWAPKPYKAVTKSLTLEVGKSWMYYMEGPEGDTHHCAAEYTKIQAQSTLGWLDAFTDENGKINVDFPRSNWTNTFTSLGDSSLVNCVITYEKLEDLEKILEMGFQGGFSMGLGNLDELLAEIQST